MAIDAPGVDEQELTDDQLRAAIRRSYDHWRSTFSCTHTYMGRTALIRLRYLLGAKEPFNPGLPELIEEIASRDKLLLAYNYLREHGYLQYREPPKFSNAEHLLQMMQEWLNTPNHYFNKRWPFFENDRSDIMREYDCNDEAAVAILFATYAEEIIR